MIVSLFIAIYAFFLPGYLVTKTSRIGNGLFTTIILSIAISITLIPIIAFSLAMIFHTVIHYATVTIAATLVNLICIGHRYLKKVKTQ